MLLDLVGLAIEKGFVPQTISVIIGEASLYLLPYWEIPRALLDMGIQFIRDNPASLIGVLSPALFAAKWIKDHIDNEEKFIDEQRNGLYPTFIGLENKTHLSNREFSKIANERYIFSYPLEPDWIGVVTNERLRKAVKNEEEIHIYRVLYRVQDEQLLILRSYDNIKNNLYFTDFDNYALKRLSIDEARVAREHYEKDYDLRQSIRVGGSAYFPNADAYYMIQLVDQCCSLSILKNLRKAKLWAVTGNPTLRATCFGPVAKPNDFHLIAYKRGYPGVSGRLLVAGAWGSFLSNEHELNNPELVSNKKEKAKALINDHLIPHYDNILGQYSDVISRYHFKNLGNFVKKVNSWKSDQILRFITSKEGRVHTTREGVIKELSKIVNATLDSRIVQM